MATINLGGDYPDTETIDQKDYDGEHLDVRGHNLSGGTTLNITNSTGSDNALTISYTPIRYTEFNLNLGPNTNVKVQGMLEQAKQYTYTLDKGAMLEYTPYPSSEVLNTTSFDLGATGSSTLVFNSGKLNWGLHQHQLPKITGLSSGDKIIVNGATQGALEGSMLVFRDADGKIVGKFDAKGVDLSNVTFEGGTMVYACFLKGTHIATPEGEVKVEALKAGDKVLTASGSIAIVKWVGHRTLYKSRIPSKDAVRAFPILFKKDSIAQNMPHRDLTLSPGHHVSFNGTLVPAMMLVNGQTIVQQFNTKVFEYFHIELEQFDIILAEGVPAETYVDTGNRSMFQNAAEVAMNPDFGPAKGRPQIVGIKIIQQGPVVEAIRKQLLARAEKMTGACRTVDAALCIEVNGQIIEPTPTFAKEGVYRFELPASVGDVHILSRSVIVRDVTVHARRDIRKIGVGLSDICVVDDGGRRELDLQDPTIEGMNATQDVHGKAMRWTDGHAIVPANMIGATGKATLELRVLRTYTYWVQNGATLVRKAA